MKISMNADLKAIIFVFACFILFILFLLLPIIILLCVSKISQKNNKSKIEKKSKNYNYLSDGEITNIDSTLNNTIINEISTNLYSTFYNAYISLNFVLVKNVINNDFFKKFNERFEQYIIDPCTLKMDFKFEYLGVTDIIINGLDEKVVVYYKITAPNVFVYNKNGMRTMGLSEEVYTDVVKIVLFRKLNSNSFIIDSFEDV